MYSCQNDLPDIQGKHLNILIGERRFMRTFFYLSLVCVALLMTLCVGHNEEVITISYQPSWHHVALFVIVEKGWDEKVLGKKLKLTAFPSGPPQMEAFAAGQHEIAYVGAAPPLSILAKGFEAKIVAIANTEGSSLIALPDVDYSGPRSLEGKSVMTFPPGSIQHTVLMKWLKDNGVNVSKVTIKQGGPAEIREALRAKAVDFGFAPDPAPYVAEVEGYGRIVVNSSEMAPDHPCCVVLMREDFMKSELAVKFIALHIIASEYAEDPMNKEEIEGILKKWLGISDEVAVRFPGTTKLQTNPRNEKWLEGLDMLCEVQYELGITKDVNGKVVKLSHEQIVDPALYEEALKVVPEIKDQLGLG